MAAKAFFGSAILAPQSSVDDGVAALRKGEIDVFLHDAPVWRVPDEKELTGLHWASDEAATRVGGEKKTMSLYSLRSIVRFSSGRQVVLQNKLCLDGCR